MPSFRLAKRPLFNGSGRRVPAMIKCHPKRSARELANSHSDIERPQGGCEEDPARETSAALTLVTDAENRKLNETHSPPEEDELQKTQESMEDAVRVETLLSCSRSSCMSLDEIVHEHVNVEEPRANFILDALSDDLSSSGSSKSSCNEFSFLDSKYDPTIVGNPTALSLRSEMSALTVKADNTTFNSHETIEAIDLSYRDALLSRTESCDSYDLRNAFQVFTEYVMRSLESREGGGEEPTAPDKPIGGMPFM